MRNLRFINVVSFLVSNALTSKRRFSYWSTVCTDVVLFYCDVQRLKIWDFETLLGFVKWVIWYEIWNLLHCGIWILIFWEPFLWQWRAVAGTRACAYPHAEVQFSDVKS